jgi:hypothetical protein
MASKKFHRKIQEVADEVMDDGETFRAGLAGTSGYNALVVVSDRNVYLIKTPPLKAYAVKEVVLKAPLGEVAVERNGGLAVRVGDHVVNHSLRMNNEADELVAQARV